MLKKNVNYKRLHEVLNYNKETGVFTWKIDAGKKGKVGAETGCEHSNGYIYISIDGKLYLAHRLAWLYVHGYFPEHGIDHKNRIKKDNWITNLREASQSCNVKNSNMRHDNTSGIKGVSWCERDKKWTVQIMVDKKAISLGYFINKLDAAKARLAAEIKYNWPDCSAKDSSAKIYINTHK